MMDYQGRFYVGVGGTMAHASPDSLVASPDSTTSWKKISRDLKCQYFHFNANFHFVI